MRLGALALATAAALTWTMTASAASSATHPPRLGGPSNSTSTTWAGYAATGGTFTDVSASWKQPTASCATGETSYSSFWVGLDGNTSSTVEQIGTDSDCVNGVPTYYAWYEPYPKLPVQVPLTVSPGASISASVHTDGRGLFTVTISVNGGRPFSAQFKLRRADLSSAEVIAEAPSSNHGPRGVLGLTDFGVVSFTGATVDGQDIGSYATDEIQMVQADGSAKATTSGLKGGDAFTVTWNHA